MNLTYQNAPNINFLYQTNSYFLFGYERKNERRSFCIERAQNFTTERERNQFYWAN